MSDQCPYCREDFSGALYESFVAKDWATYFDFDCPHCGEKVDVTVEAIPHFVCAKRGESR